MQVLHLSEQIANCRCFISIALNSLSGHAMFKTKQKNQVLNLCAFNGMFGRLLFC